MFFGWLLLCWLVPVALAWPHRKTSPLWAWTRIVAGVWMFSVFELMVWFPKLPNLDPWFYVGVGVYIAMFLVKRNIAAENQN